MANFISRRSRYGDAYSHGNHDLGYHDKADFKRREMEHELGHETNSNYKSNSKPVLKGYYFYNVSSDDAELAAEYGIKQTKSGKWALAVYDTSGGKTANNKRKADEYFGSGRWWSPNDKKKTNEADAPSIGTVTATSDKDVSFKDDKTGIETKVPTSSGLLAKDEKGNLVFNKAAAAGNTQQPTTPNNNNKLAQTGQKVQVNASLDNELESIMKNAGLK